MKAVSGTQMRGLDRRTIEEKGISGERLMQIAGIRACGGILKWLEAVNATPDFLILAGKGNNGGDAFVVAGMLADGYNVSLHCTVPESELSGDALTMFQRLPASVRENISYDLTPKDLSRSNLLIVDGLLGTGFHGALREPYRSWCRLVNASGKTVAALDIPSGLDADSGEVDPDAVIADFTFTMAAPKTGMFSPEGIRHTGRLQVLDIGIPQEFIDELPDTIECTGPDDIRPFFRKEAFDIHKYNRGHLFVIGGCLFYPGAPLLASEAGLRAGAGLVTCCIPEHAEIHSAIPKALIVRRLAAEPGWFTKESTEILLNLLKKAAACVVGPGMGTPLQCFDFLEKILPVNLPLVLDADALNLIAADPELMKLVSRRQSPTVLTPHAGEMKRLLTALNLNPAELSRQDAALGMANKLNAVVVAKGARTLVAAPDGRFAVNLSGCPALATAGTGDILAGMTGAMLLKRDLDVFDAVRTAVFLHGQTAETTAPLDSCGYIADDFLPMIGKVIRSYSSSSME